MRFADYCASCSLTVRVYSRLGISETKFSTYELLIKNYKNVQKINFDRSAGNFKFSNDQKGLFFTAQANGGQPLYKLDLLTNKVVQITDFESGITNFDLNESKIVYFKTSIENPLELYVATTEMKQEKKISSLNSWVADRQISKMTKASFKNEKGLDVDYWIMKPTQFDVNKKLV